VSPEHVRVAGIDQRLLVGSAKEGLGMTHQILVQWVVLPDEHVERCLAPPSGAPCLLPGAGHGAGVADEHSSIQFTHVDAQLQGVGGGYRQQLSSEQSPLDVASFLGSVATTIGSYARCEVGPLAQGVPGIAQDEFGHLACPGEGDVAHILADHLDQQAGGLGIDTGAAPAGCVEHRWVPQHEPPGALRGAIVVHHNCRLANQPGRVIAGVADGRR